MHLRNEQLVTRVHFGGCAALDLDDAVAVDVAKTNEDALHQSNLQGKGATG